MSDSAFIRRVSAIGVPIITLLVGVQMGVGYERQQLSPAPDALLKSATGAYLQPEKQADLRLLWQTWQLLNERYVSPKDLDGRKMTLGAVEGMVRAVGDPYTMFLNADESSKFRESMGGDLEGIGAELMDRNGVVVVVAPIKNSPAEKAGILPEDIITHVDGQLIADLSLDQVVSRIRGKPGTSVTLTVYHHDDPNPHKITVLREHITVPSVESAIINAAKGPIGHLTLRQFGDHSIDEVRTVLNEFKVKQVKGIVLDLRFNGGGYLDGAVELVSMFLREGTVVSVERRGQQTEVLKVTGETIFPDTPLVVLINEGTASASEITAGALQDHKRAMIVGTKSFGKGTVQDVLELPGGSTVHVTIAHWLTPQGKNLAKEGIDPDIVVERTAEQYKAKKDPQLDKAVEVLDTPRGIR